MFAPSFNDFLVHWKVRVVGVDYRDIVFASGRDELFEAGNNVRASLTLEASSYEIV
jgi:hypothetical protein